MVMTYMVYRAKFQLIQWPSKRELFYSSRDVRYLQESVKSVATVAVDNGATFNSGRGGNCKHARPISLHAVP